MGYIDNLQNIFEWAKENTQSYGDKSILIENPILFDDNIYALGLQKDTFTNSYWSSPLGEDRNIEERFSRGSWNAGITAERLAIVDNILGSWNGYTVEAPYVTYLPYKNAFFTCNFTKSNNTIDWVVSMPDGVYWHELTSYRNPFALTIGGFDPTCTGLTYKFGALVGGTKIGFYICAKWNTAQGVQCGGWDMFTVDVVRNLREYLGTASIGEVPKDFDNNYGSGGVAQGLQGIVDTLTSDVNVPLKSNKGVTGTGFVNIYEISTNQLTDFGKDMFSDVDLDFDYDASEDITETQSQYGEFTLAEDSLANMANITHGFKNIFSLVSSAIKNYFSSKLVNYVLSVHIIPVSPTTSASAERINVGYKTFTQTAKRVTSDYIDYDCGTLTIPSKYKNFLDFTQTKAKIYLPFIGMVDISPQYFYDCTIGLKYRFSVIDGTCVAFLTSTKMSGNTSLIGTYNGSCCLHIPFTGENYANMITGVIQGVGGVVSGVSTANPMLAIGGAMQGASSIAKGMSGTLLGSPQSSSSASFMGVRTPYIIIERPVPQLPPSYFDDGGAVAMITEKIGNCEGFTKCKNVHCSISTHKSINDKITQILETGFHA